MSKITAYKDSINSKLIHIVPSGFEEGTTSAVNVKILLDDYVEKNVNFSIVEEKPEVSYKLDSGSGSKYIREYYILTIESNKTLNNLIISSDNERIKIETLEENKIKLYTLEEDGVEEITSNITISADNIEDIVFPLVFLGLKTIDISIEENNIPYDIPIFIFIGNITDEVIAVSDNDSITTEVIDYKNNKYIVCKATEPSTGTISITGRSILDAETTVIFTEKDTLVLDITPSDGIVFINEEITINVSGTSRPISASADNEDFIVTVEDYLVKVVSPKPGNGIITIYGDGIMASQTDINVQSLQDFSPTITPDTREVYVGQYITYEFTETDRSNITHEVSDNSDGLVTVEESASNPNAFQVKSTGAVSGRTITFKASGYNDYVTTVTFNQKDTLTVAEGNSITKYLDDEITLNVSGTEKTFTATSDDDETATASVSGKVVTVTPKKAGTVNITLAGDGIESLIVAITINELMEMVLSGSDTVTAKYNKEITVEVTTPSSNVTHEIASSPDSSITVSPSGNTFVLTASEPCTGTLTLKAQNYKDKQVTITFEDLSNIEASVTPSNTVKKNNKISIQVTTPVNGDGITFQKTGNFTVEDKGNGLLEVTSADPDTGNITLKADGYNDKVIAVTFEEYDELAVNVTPSSSEQVGNTITALVTSDTTSEITYDVQSEPASSITVQKDSGNEKQFSITASAECTGTVTFKSEGFLDKAISLTFTAAPVIQDEIQVSLSPSSVATVGDTITATVTGTTKAIEAKSDNNKITPVVNDKTITITATEAGSATITVSGAGVVTKTFSVEFKEKTTGPQFSVDETNVVFNESDVFKDIKINNLVGKLTGTCSSNLLDLSILEDDYLRIELLEQIKEDLTATIVLSVEGQNSVTLNVTVKNDKQEIPTMSIDGKVYISTVGEEIYFVTPTPDEGASVQVTAPQGVTSRVDIDRVYLKSDTEGTYTVEVALSGYKTATVTFKVGIKASVITPAEKHYYDLGPAPKVELVYNKDNFVDKVFEDTTMTTDKEKLAYILENGDTDIISTANVLCKYQSVLSNKSNIDISSLGGQYNFMLYAKLMAVINAEDYYSFRSSLKVILKIFKVYKDDAFNVLNLNRFELKWPSDSVKLEEYKLLVTFLSEYVAKNGTGISASPLPFSPEVKSRFNRFIQEGFRP